jgi:hypothetical protein
MGILQVDLRVTIRLKVATGVLPKDAPVKMFAGYGTGKVCAACDLSTTKKDVEYDVGMADGRTFSFHQLCITLWHQERATSNRSSAIVARRYPRPMTDPPQKGDLHDEGDHGSGCHADHVQRAPGAARVADSAGAEADGGG